MPDLSIRKFVKSARPESKQVEMLGSSVKKMFSPLNTGEHVFDRVREPKSNAGNNININTWAVRGSFQIVHRRAALMKGD